MRTLYKPVDLVETTSDYNEWFNFLDINRHEY